MQSQRVGVEVAALLDALECSARFERERGFVARFERDLDLRPSEGSGYGRSVSEPERVHADRRLVPVVLPPVDEHFAGPFAPRLGDERTIRVARLVPSTESDRAPCGVVSAR